MVFAFGHLLGAWIAGKGYQLLSKRKLSHYTWFFLLFGGILPDVDLLFDWVLGADVHRELTHNFLFAIIFPLLVYFIFYLLKEKDGKNLAFALSCGILVHLFLDIISTKGVPLFWPSQWYFSIFNSYYGKMGASFLEGSTSLLNDKFVVLDMALGTAWIFYLILRKRIKL